MGAPIGYIDPTTRQFQPVDFDHPLPVTGGGGGGGGSLAETLWTDNSGAYYIRKDTGLTVSFVDPTGAAATPGAGLRPVGAAGKQVQSANFDVLTAGTGYSLGDLLVRLIIVDTANPSNAPTIIWINSTTTTVITAPTAANVEMSTESIKASITASALPTGAAQDGTDGASAPANPSGGTGIRGWLSGAVKTLIAIALQLPVSLGAKTQDASLAVVHAGATVTRCSFADTGAGLVTADMTQIGTTGAGITVAQAGGNLSISTGTTINAEFFARSNATVSGAWINRYKAVLSQRIAGQHAMVALADLIGAGLAFTTDATGTLVTVTKAGHGFTAANVGQGIYVGGILGIATAVPGRLVISSVPDANTIVLSQAYACTWTRSTTTATVTFTGGNPVFSLNEGATVSASSDTAAIVNGAVTLLTQNSGGTTTFTCLNGGATSGNLTLTMSAKAWTASASGTLTLFGWNCYSHVFNGTSATVAFVDAQRRGWANGATNAAIATTASPGVVVHTQTDATFASVDTCVAATATAFQFAQAASRLENLPDDSVPLYLFVQVYNGVSAPASTTTLTLGMWSLERLGNVKFHLAGASQTGVGHALQAKVTDAISVTGTLTTNVGTINSNSLVASAAQGATNKSLGVYLSGCVPFTAYSAQAWAAASGSGSAIVDTNGGGSVYSFDISTTVWTVNTSTGMVIVVEDSADSGTTWTIRWITEKITAVGHVRIPALYLEGRVRMRWFHVSGSATTATVTVVAQALSFSPAKQVQYFDYTAGVGSGTAVLNTSSGTYDWGGIKAGSVVMDAGAATTAGQFKVQMSQNGSGWYDASAAVTATAATLTPIPLTAGVYGRFIKVVCVNAGSAATINGIHINGTN